MAFEDFETTASCQRPETDSAVATARHSHASVGSECHTRDGRGMAFKRANAPAARNFPKAQTAIVTSGKRQTVVLAERQGKHRVLVAFQSAQAFAPFLQFPDAKCVI